MVVFRWFVGVVGSCVLCVSRELALQQRDSLFTAVSCDKHRLKTNSFLRKSAQVSAWFTCSKSVLGARVRAASRTMEQLFALMEAHDYAKLPGIRFHEETEPLPCDLLKNTEPMRLVLPALVQQARVFINSRSVSSSALGFPTAANSPHAARLKRASAAYELVGMDVLSDYVNEIFDVDVKNTQLLMNAATRAAGPVAMAVFEGASLPNRLVLYATEISRLAAQVSQFIED